MLVLLLKADHISSLTKKEKNGGKKESEKESPLACLVIYDRPCRTITIYAFIYCITRCHIFGKGKQCEVQCVSLFPPPEDV